MPIKDGLAKLKQGGGRFVFELFIELYREDIVNGFKKYLERYTVEDIVKMVDESRFPSLAGLNLREAHDYVEYIEKITPKRFFEAMADARVDLAEAILDQGDKGVEYIVKLREHIIELVKSPGKSMAEAKDYSSKGESKTKLATCMDCHQSFPVPIDATEDQIECPFCKKDEKTPPPPPEEED